MDKSVLHDNHGRPLNYLRLSVTDRCNLRCFYCMPAEGIRYVPRSELLTYEELITLTALLSDMGISKVRITGGEPFVRTDLISFLTRLVAVEGIEEVAITTNGVLISQHISQLRELGIRKINLSLDTLDPVRFNMITRRNEFDKVWKTYQTLLDQDFEIKLNCVVIENQNIEDIIPFVELTKTHPVEVRFIEEMPFNGEGAHYPVLKWTHKKVLDHIMDHFEDTIKLEDPASSTSSNYKVRGYQGSFGVIAAFSRTFCGSCNRIRLSATGDMRTCLYGEAETNLRDLLRSGASLQQLKERLMNLFQNRPKNGFEAESRRNQTSPAQESMSILGG